MFLTEPQLLAFIFIMFNLFWFHYRIYAIQLSLFGQIELHIFKLNLKNDFHMPYLQYESGLYMYTRPQRV